MSSHLVRRVRQPVSCESLEGRTLFSSTPVLLHEVVSVKGRLASFHGSLLNGDAFTVQLHTGTADIYSVDNRLQLVVTGTTTKSNLTIQGSVQAANISIDGPLNNFNAANVSLAGTLATAGSVNRLTLGSLTGIVAVNGSVKNLKVGGVIGTIAVADTIKNLTTGALLNADILSGTTLGLANAFFSEIPVPASPYGAGSIGTLTIHGPMLHSTIAVGANPGLDGAFGSGDDASAGGGTIAHLTITNGADDTSIVEAGAFGVVRIGVINTLQPPKRLIDPLTDVHFRLLA